MVEIDHAERTLREGGIVITLEVCAGDRRWITTRLVPQSEVDSMPSDGHLSWFTDELVAGITVADVREGRRGQPYDGQKEEATEVGYDT